MKKAFGILIAIFFASCFNEAKNEEKPSKIATIDVETGAPAEKRFSPSKQVKNPIACRLMPTSDFLFVRFQLDCAKAWDKIEPEKKGYYLNRALTKDFGNGNTLLIESVKDNYDIKAIKFLIENGADVNARNYSGKTPLCYAAALGNIEITELLLDKGAKVNAVSEDGTALQLAKKKGYIDVVRLLQERK